MKTIVKKVFSQDDPCIKEAANIIKNGGLVAFPTETVYGLGANGLDDKACDKVYAVKGRPSDNPLILHIANMSQLDDIAESVPEAARKLAEKFWPGPLTIIFRPKNVPRGTSAKTIALRMPKNDIARKLIEYAETPIAAPSANLSGRPSPTSVAHVLSDLDGLVDMVLDGGNCEHGLESTVIDCTTHPCAILRPGSVTKEMIEAEIGPVQIISEIASGDVPKSPGMKYKHYAPKAKLTIVRGSGSQVRNKIISLAKNCSTWNIGIAAASESLSHYEGFTVLNMGANTAEIAANLFSVLRKCDEIGLSEVFVEAVEEKGLGVAIMNRLKKAASYNIVEV